MLSLFNVFMISIHVQILQSKYFEEWVWKEYHNHKIQFHSTWHLLHRPTHKNFRIHWSVLACTHIHADAQALQDCPRQCSRRCLAAWALWLIQPWWHLALPALHTVQTHAAHENRQIVCPCGTSRNSTPQIISFKTWLRWLHDLGIWLYTVCEMKNYWFAFWVCVPLIALATLSWLAGPTNATTRLLFCLTAQWSLTLRCSLPQSFTTAPLIIWYCRPDPPSEMGLGVSAPVGSACASQYNASWTLDSPFWIG